MAFGVRPDQDERRRGSDGGRDACDGCGVYADGGRGGAGVEGGSEVEAVRGGKMRRLVDEDTLSSPEWSMAIEDNLLL